MGDGGNFLGKDYPISPVSISYDIDHDMVGTTSADCLERVHGWEF